MRLTFPQNVVLNIEVEIERALKIYQMDGELLLIINLYQCGKTVTFKSFVMDGICDDSL